MKVVIMAGGKGSRISSITNNVPKPMIKINNKPILEHEIESLKAQGFTDFIITVNHLKEAIIEYFGDGSNISPVTNQSFGVNIKYFIEKEPLGNAGALFKLKDILVEDFVLLNGDIVFDIDFHRFITFHKKHGGLVTLFTHPNTHPYDSALIVANENAVVNQWLEKDDIRPSYYRNRVNAGIHIINPAILDIPISTKKINLDKHILKPLSRTGKLFCYDSPEYVKDMGTPKRYYNVCSDYDRGIIAAKNLKNKQKAVFLDRDGTINKYVRFLHNIDDFKLIEGVAEAIKKINESGYLAIVITNQPVIARGELDYEELDLIHNKLETLLGDKHAYIDAIYYCPHHPHKGYEGEREELKIQCTCRKPQPGMLLKAALDFNIDLEQSWMVGDRESDIKAGKSAGCKTVLIGNEKLGQDFSVNSLFEFIEILYEHNNLLKENI